MNYTFLGKKLNYEYTKYKKADENEDKPTLVFLHGWGGSIDSFRGLINEFKDNYDILAMDFWGFGKSDDPNEDWDLKQYTQAVEALISNELKIRKVVIIAHSFGGRVAIKLCKAIPTIAKKLILIDSAGLKPKYSLKKSLKVKKYKFYKWLVKIHFLKMNRLESFGSADYKLLTESMRKVFTRVVNDDLTDVVKTLSVPTLLMWGEKDLETPLYMARRFHKWIQDSGLIIFDNAGHYSYIERHQQFTIIIKNFLSEE